MDSFSTSDLGEAAFLVTVGFPCTNIRPADGEPGRCFFVFGPGAAEASEDYYRGAKVEAQRLLLVERELKGRLFRARR